MIHLINNNADTKLCGSSYIGNKPATCMSSPFNVKAAITRVLPGAALSGAISPFPLGYSRSKNTSLAELLPNLDGVHV